MMDQGQTLMDIMNQLEGVRLKEKHGGNFIFRMHLTQEMIDTSIEALDLSVRSFHSLKRAGFTTVGELVDSCSGSEDLKKLRNCGSKSVREIMEHLFLFNYYSMKPERRPAYLEEVVLMNVAKNSSK